MKEKSEQSQIILYTTPEGDIKVDTILQNETIWLTQNAMAELFGVNVPAISKHLKNIFEEGELQREATLSKMETVQKEGGAAGFPQQRFLQSRCYYRHRLPGKLQTGYPVQNMGDGYLKRVYHQGFCHG